MKRVFLTMLATAAVVCSTEAAAPKKAPAKKGKKGEVTQVADSTAKKKPAAGTIEAVLKPNAKAQKGGMMDVYQQDDKYYFMIPKGLLGRDILLVNRLSQGAAGLRNGFSGYAGDQIQEAMIRFVESPDGKNIFIQNIMTREMPRDTVGEMYQAVMRSNFQPLAAVFKIEAQNKAKDSVLINVTDFINSDNDLAAFNGYTKQSLNLNNFQKDRSYISGVKAYPINVEMRSVKTYNYAPKSISSSFQIPPRPVTVEVNSSMVLLPEQPMKPRYDDRRVGYFTDNYVDYEKNPQGVKNVSMISRFRLEPKDVEAYKRGELVEPIKPIVVYIDPATPKKWVPYLIQGVNDWQEAFEQAGFKNAIYALEAPTPEQDSTWSLEDARFSAIVYKPSDIPNASGPHVSDPRSGETMEFHINWYHNVQKLLRNWYMLQVGPNDPRARQMTFPEDLMGELIRFVSSHEVGHSLGLRHNMGATSLVPVDSLRSRTYLQKYGHTPSIMDYSRFNYAVQPEDGIEPELQYPRIKEYDKWAIEYGYRYLPQFATAEDERTHLNQWVIEQNKNPRLWFGHEMNREDPRSQTEDLGDNQMKANALGIKNLKRVIEGLPEWTKEPNENYASLKEMYTEVVTQYTRYIGHVAKWMGGVYENPKTVEQGGVVYTFAPKDKQEEAMRWLKEYVIDAPEWLDNKEIFAKTGLNKTVVLNRVYSTLFSRLLSPVVLSNMVEAKNTLGNKAYTMNDLFTTLNRDVWGDLNDSSEEKRIMQSIYVEYIVSLYRMLSGDIAMPDVDGMVNYQMRNLLSKLKAANPSDIILKGHYQVLIRKLELHLDPKNSTLMRLSFSLNDQQIQE